MKRVIAIALALSGCSHTAVYRTKGPAEPTVRRVCEESGLIVPGPDAGTFKCLVLHGTEWFSARFGGDVFRVFGDASAQTDVALFLGRNAPDVVLVDFK